MPIFDNVYKLIGRTPIVKLNTIAPKNVNMFVKCEFMNPGASVKDRLAIGLIEHAEKTGALKPGQTVVEATSGNTGISLAMVCAAKGYPFVATMAETFSIERRKLMRMYGAKVILTPKELKGTGMVKKAEELSKKHGWFLPRQFENEANPRYHANTTGPEILSDFASLPLDYYVTGYGTGGTLMGAGKMIKTARPDTKIIGTEPANAQLMSGKTKWEPHPIQGWTPDFLAKIIDPSIADEIIPVTGPMALSTSHLLAQKEGLLVGISAGATVAAALEVAKKAKDGAYILAMLPDTGERYLSTPLFENITEGQEEPFDDVDFTCEP